jgi:hypothetical protein
MPGFIEIRVIVAIVIVLPTAIFFLVRAAARSANREQKNGGLLPLRRKETGDFDE